MQYKLNNNKIINLHVQCSPLIMIIVTNSLLSLKNISIKSMSCDGMFMLCRLESQILARFEEENGGELLVATLCLLEASNHGLLEVELMTILGDEDHLMPRQEHEDDSESAGKSALNHLLF